MAVKLRLKRMGAKGKPFYRVVAADSRAKRDGKFIEELGTYNPLTNPAEINLKNDRILAWLKDGATPTDTAKDLFRKAGIMTAFHNEKVGK